MRFYDFIVDIESIHKDADNYDTLQNFQGQILQIFIKNLL